MSFNSFYGSEEEEISGCDAHTVHVSGDIHCWSETKMDFSFPFKAAAVRRDTSVCCDLCVQIRKQQKDHAELIEDYRTKQQQRALQQQQQPAAPPMMPAGAPPIPQTLLSQPMVSMQPHPGGPTPAHVPNAPSGWTSGSGAPGVMGQRMTPQMPPALPNAPQAPTHTQTPPAMVPGLAASTAGFTAGPRGPTGGPNGAAGDGAPRQVTHLKPARTFN